MKIISWNVNGIRAITQKESFSLKPLKGDIICFQEIKASKEQFPKEPFTSFNLIETNSAKRAGYSGVATLSNINFAQTLKTEHIDADEGRILEHHFDDIVLFNVYFPNGQKNEERLDYKMHFYNAFLEHCEALKKEGKSIIVCGDVNTAHREIDLKNPKTNANRSGFLPSERAWIDKFLAHGYRDTFREIHGDIEGAYSWWSYRFNARKNNAGWRIDYFFISEDLLPKLKDAFILANVIGSDHCPVGIDIDV